MLPEEAEWGENIHSTMPVDEEEVLQSSMAKPLKSQICCNCIPWFRIKWCRAECIFNTRRAIPIFFL